MQHGMVRWKFHRPTNRLSLSESNDTAQKICYSCLRIRGITRNWFPEKDDDAAGVCAWPYQDGRGNICNSCWNCWRTVLKLTVPLTCFKDWLVDNKVEWGFLLFAYLSLVREMSKRSLTEGLVRDRAGTMRWMLSVGFFHGGASEFRVVPLNEVDTKKIQAHELVTMRIGGKDQIGAIIPATFAADSSTLIPRPNPNNVALNPFHSCLSTDNATDRDSPLYLGPNGV